MKKSIQFLTVLSTAAMMAALAPQAPANILGSSMTAYAATVGWVQEDGEMRYLDRDGYYLTDTWKKKDNEWYYLNEDGYVSRSEMIDEYYVDEDGKRVTNRWIGVPNDDAWEDDEPETYWYYYGKDGKYVASRWQTIDNKSYYFNDDGHMETGKITLDGYTYYLGSGDDGYMRTGWVQLENEDESSDEDMVWHYFDSRGRMVMNQVDRKISGKYYTFENGVLQTGWYKLPVEETASASNAPAQPAIASYQYYEADGSRASGWHTMEGAEGISEEGEEFTFYFKEGRPDYAQSGIELFTVDSKRYGFNDRGEMQTGLQRVTFEDGTIATCYFGDDGVLKTGKQHIYDEDLGETQTWLFRTDGANKGQGFHGVRDNNVYRDGLRLDADRDLRYAPVELDGVHYLVNASGSIQKASSSSKSSAKPELGSGYRDFKDSNDKVWTVNTEGIVQQ